jgi:hypothetical protein
MCDDDVDADDGGKMFSIPNVSTFSKSLIDLSFAFFSNTPASFSLFLWCTFSPVIFFRSIPALDVKNEVSDTGSTYECDNVGEALSGELQGVFVGEKLFPHGVFKQLGVIA